MSLGNLAVKGSFNQEQEVSASPPVMADSSSSSLTCLQPAPQLMSIQLTENNYILWKSLFIPVLKAYNMLNHAEGREQCPPQFLTTDEDEEENRNENPAYTSWIRRDQMFLTWINASLSPKLLRYTRECTSGQALWVHLEDVLTKSAEAHVLKLKARLRNLEFKTYLLEKHFSNAEEIADELEAAGSSISDREFTSCILEKLPESYEEVVASVRNKPHPVTKKELHDLLLSHRTKMDLRARLRNLKFNGLIMSYLDDARTISSGLEAAGSPVNDHELTSRILDGLPKGYGKLVSSIKNQPHPITPEELHKILGSHIPPTPIGERISLFIDDFVVIGLILCLILISGFFLFSVILAMTGRELDYSEFKIVKIIRYK